MFSGKPEGIRTMSEAEGAEPTTVGGVAQSSTNAGLVIAVLWAAISVIAGLIFILGTPDIEYGGDAYTGIQAAAAQTARAVGWLIIATGALGLVIATTRRSPK